MTQIQRIDLLFGPAEIGQIKSCDLEKTTCVIFDILRFTSTATTALGHGAAAVIPAKSINNALEIHQKYPEAFLAGERNGSKIGASLTGGIDFNLGNSPLEYTKQAIEGKTIISTTTNGTIALNACKMAPQVLATSFLNMTACVDWVLRHPTERVCLVCSGTHGENSYEDMLGAGAFATLLIKRAFPEHSWGKRDSSIKYSDSVLAVSLLFEQASEQGLAKHFSFSRNGKALAAIPALAPDVPFCTQWDLFPHPILLDQEGKLSCPKD